MSLQQLNNVRYNCKVCKKELTDYSLLEEHEIKHSKERPYTCKYCSKGYTERKVFSQHLRKSHQVSEEEITQLRWTFYGVIFKDGICNECCVQFI